ncbi:MAG: hypothetical protein EXR98_06335 [Gemmataceae bacterium]|nr:hypothetical protein [Gemmataceae bacterium]
MPIRFRCAYCNQLMGISRKKAGTVVRCPKCAGEIIVPTPDGAQEPEDAAYQQAGPGALEDMNIEQILKQPETAPAVVPPPEERAPAAPPIAAMPPELAPPPPAPVEPPRRVGLFLSLGMLLVSSGVVVLLLILMFVFGLIIGKHLGLAEKKSTAGLFPSPSHARGAAVLHSSLSPPGEF